ncbi:glycosyl hydrolase 53 family protein [Streptomyces sp. NRRL F-5650]|uniref:glycosyl hydrolase 53 family protein n=1 Tax=Streptomyces sp. NRRL F-5650 TaxID=1463868 RepID=UPI0004CC2C74|nr:glycosyl hydrolase 53 family protein [Streptomyces sp. NRRL F-5650]
MHGTPATPGRLTRRTALTAALGGAAALALPAPRAAASGTLGNGGFEQGTTGWSQYGTSGAAYAEAGGRSGGRRLAHWASSAYRVETYQYLTGLSNGMYTLTAWVRSSGGQNEAYIGLRTAAGEQRTDLPPTPNGEWLRLVTSLAVTDGTATVRLYSDANAGDWANFDDITLTPGATGLAVRGADISSLKKNEDMGATYRNPSGARADAIGVLASAGMNHARLRVWVDPADGYCDKARTLAMARRVKAAGLKLLVDFHYSDTWTDPGAQTVPAAWSGHSYARLTTDVHDHTYDVLNALKAQGTPADMVQIGNELNAGMLWPTGSTSDWAQLAGLLTAGANAAKAVSSATRVALHLANGGDNALYRTWFDNAVSYGVPFDVIGLSFYGYWHGSLSDLQANMDDLATRYGRDLYVAETAYPFTLDGDDSWENVIDLESELVAGYAATGAGQAAWFRDLLSVVEAVPNGRGLGAFWWDATWTARAGNGWDPADPSSGNAWENQALFDFDGVPTAAQAWFRHR